MRFLKEKKGIIISFIIGVILASSITVYATSYFASDVKYTKKDGTEISVESALNALYSNISANSIVSLASEDKVSSINCSIGDYFLIQTVYADGDGNITGLTGCQVIATCIGPVAYGVNSTGVLVCATSTTISASNQFGYIKLGIQEH